MTPPTNKPRRKLPESEKIRVTFNNTLVCRYCQRIFKSKQGLGSHKRYQHGIITPRIGNY